MDYMKNEIEILKGAFNDMKSEIEELKKKDTLNNIQLPRGSTFKMRQTMPNNSVIEKTGESLKIKTPLIGKKKL